jgi:NAD(P)-dependent dehydrogenase (short-subunit alcohol dehydrogenase family)
VTGAGSGIGRHAALVLAAAGASVVACGRRSGPLQETVAAIVGAGGAATSVTMDLADLASVSSAVAAAEQAHGSVDILVNNAGVAGHSSLVDMTEQEWDAILDTNLKGAWHCAREVARLLIAANRPGAIVNIASVLGVLTQKGTGAYAASKAALLHLTRAMAAEWARHGIRVNAIAPGYIETDMTGDFLGSERGKRILAGIPQRRVGAVEDITGPLLLLAGNASAYMTGSVVTVDGGISLGSL